MQMIGITCGRVRYMMKFFVRGPLMTFTLRGRMVCQDVNPVLHNSPNCGQGQGVKKLKSLMTSYRDDLKGGPQVP